VRWTRALRRTRRSIRSTLHRVEASARVIGAAERFAPSRPAAAVQQLVVAGFWLAEAAADLDRAARGLRDTTDSIAIDGAAAGAPQRVVDATLHWIVAAGRLVHVSNDLDASFARLSAAIANGVIRNNSLRAPAVATPPRAVQNGNVAGGVAGARKISRGRAPPFVSICTL
jgi:hypothetical protein